MKLLQHRKKDWISILKKNRNLEVNSFVLRDAQSQPIALQGPHIAVQDLVPLIPARAYRPVKVEDETYWAFTFTVRIPKLGEVRLVISYENADLTGTYAVRSCIWTVRHPHGRKEACPSKPSGKRVASRLRPSFKS